MGEALSIVSTYNSAFKGSAIYSYTKILSDLLLALCKEALSICIVTLALYYKALSIPFYENIRCLLVALCAKVLSINATSIPYSGVVVI